MAGVAPAEMFEVYNMGIGFCVILAEDDAMPRWRSWRGTGGTPGLSAMRSPTARNPCTLPQQRLIGTGKRFRPDNGIVNHAFVRTAR